MFQMSVLYFSHSSTLEFGMGARNQAVAPGITRPLYAPGIHTVCNEMRNKGKRCLSKYFKERRSLCGTNIFTVMWYL